MSRLILSNQFLNPFKLRFFLKHLGRAAKQPKKTVQPEKTEKVNKNEALRLYKRLQTLKNELDRIKKKKRIDRKEIETLTRKIKNLGSRLKQ